MIQNLITQHIQANVEFLNQFSKVNNKIQQTLIEFFNHIKKNFKVYPQKYIYIYIGGEKRLTDFSDQWSRSELNAEYRIIDECLNYNAPSSNQGD